MGFHTVGSTQKTHSHTAALVGCSRHRIEIAVRNANTVNPDAGVTALYNGRLDRMKRSVHFRTHNLVIPTMG